MKKVFKVKEKDSILQEYEEIRKELGKAKYEALNKYLATHKNILLSDVYYNENEWNKFDAWFKNGMKDNENTSIVDSNNYVIYKSGSDIMGTNEDNYNTRIQNAREIQNFSRQGFKNVEEVVEYVKKYFKVPGKIIVKDGGITERLEEANEIIKENLEDSISEQEALAQIVKADKRFSDPRTQIKYVGKAKTTTGKEMDKYVVGIKGGPIQYNAYFWESGKLNYISTAPKGTINDAEDFITYFTNKSFSSAGNFLDYVHYKFGDYKWSNNSDGSMNVVVNGKRYRVTFDYSNTTDPDAKCKIKSIKAVDRKSVKDADPTYRSVWLKVKEYVKNHYNFNYKNDFRGLMDFLNNQYGGSIDEDKVYDILRDLNGKGYIIFVKDSKLKDAHIYLFAKSDINRSDIEEAKKYGLEVLGTNRNGSEVNLVMRGDLANLKKYAKEYLDYVLHPGYLYRENEFAGKITRDEEIKNTDKAPNSSMVNELKRKVEEFKRRGYDEEDLKITVDGNKVWFTGELSYSTHEKLANELDKIVAKYDKDAYFDAETSGRWVAHFFDNSIKDDADGYMVVTADGSKLAVLLGAGHTLVANTPNNVKRFGKYDTEQEAKTAADKIESELEKFDDIKVKLVAKKVVNGTIKDSKISDKYFVVACEEGDYWYNNEGKPDTFNNAKRYNTYESADYFRKNLGKGSVQKIGDEEIQEDSKLKDSHNYNIKEKQQITVIAPYDDADYYWAKFEYDMPNGELWSVINSNHRVEKKITVRNTNQIISELEKYNANIKPRIIKDSKVKDDEVYHITKEQWNKIPNAYKGKTPDGKRTVFAAFVYPNGGTTLLTEGAHFVIDGKSKMKDYQSYVGFAGAEKLKQDIKNYNGNPAVFSYFLKPKQASSIELMGAIINKQEFFLTMVMKTATYKGDLAGAKKDALRAVDEITKTWKSLSYEDNAIKDGKYVINNMNDLKRLFTNFPKGDVDISYGRSGFYYHIRPKADGKVSLGSAGYDGTFNTLKEALEWVVYDFRDLILNVNPDGSDRDSAIKDYTSNVNKSSSYKVIEKFPNGYGVAQTYGDGLFYVFDKNGDVLYASYAFKSNAIEAAKNMRDSKTYKVTHKDKSYKVKAGSKRDAALIVARKVK